MIINVINFVPPTIPATDIVVTRFKVICEEIAQKAGGSVKSFEYSNGDVKIDIDECAADALKDLLLKMAEAKKILFQ